MNRFLPPESKRHDRYYLPVFAVPVSSLSHAFSFAALKQEALCFLVLNKSSEAGLQLYQRNHFCLIEELPDDYIRVIFDTFSKEHADINLVVLKSWRRAGQSTAHRLIGSREGTQMP